MSVIKPLQVSVIIQKLKDKNHEINLFLRNMNNETAENNNNGGKKSSLFGLNNTFNNGNYHHPLDGPGYSS